VTGMGGQGHGVREARRQGTKYGLRRVEFSTEQTGNWNNRIFSWRQATRTATAAADTASLCEPPPASQSLPAKVGSPRRRLLEQAKSRERFEVGASLPAMRLSISLPVLYDVLTMPSVAMTFAVRRFLDLPSRYSRPLCPSVQAPGKTPPVLSST